MQLLECYIESFGTFKEYSHKFDRGLNCIYSDNATATTTLSIFIASMLYGLADTKKQSLDENERKKYTPWQGGRFGGSLTFLARGKIYTVERTFGTKASDDLFVLRNKSSGAVSTDFSANLGEELFGIDRDGFLRTVFLSEKNLSVKNENKSISAKLSDLVGVDGDLGGFDDALELLDKRRKFYYKQSGNCEINNIKLKITEKKLEFEHLNAVALRAAESEKRLLSLTEEKNILLDKKSEYSDKITRDSKIREHAANEERYSAMLARARAHRIRLSELEEFFGGIVPEPSKIDEARFSLFEGERLRKEIETEGLTCASHDERYARLSFDTLGSVDSAHSELRTLKSELDSYESNCDKEYSKIKEIFPSDAPSVDDVAKCKKAYGKESLSLPLMLGVLGVFSMLIGIILGIALHPSVYLLSALGIAVLSLSLALLIKKSNQGKKSVQYLLEKTGRSGAPTREALYRIETDLVIFKELVQRRNARIAEAQGRYNELYLSLDAFTDEFAIPKVGDLATDIECIRRAYTEYYTASQSRGVGNELAEKRMATANEMIAKARAFLSRYETKTSDPFAELASLSAEYGYTKVALERETIECDEYAKKYGTTGEVIQNIATDDTALEEIAKCEMRISEITREYGMLLGEYERDMRECEKIDGITSELSELNVTLERYNDNLAIIKATSLLLEEASNNMTSRYIGKTRDYFVKYEDLIGGSGGDYAVDTDFIITKSERGAQRGEECYSRGTRDLYAFALRLALIDTLFEGEEPFVILDDPFISFDDEKSKRARKLLSEIAKEKQVIYFTCSSSRAV